MNEIELTKRLIEIESVSGNELEILKFLADFLRDNSAEVWQNEDFAAGLFRVRKSKSVSKTRHAVILTGHIDTVSAGYLKSWKDSPWRVIETDDKIIGLGASDMKGGISAQIIAGLEFVRGDNFESDFDLWIVAVSNEEVDGRGSRNFVKWLNSRVDFEYEEVLGIIAEPTNCENIEIGHRGNRFVRLKFAGESGHASQQGNFAESALSRSFNFVNNIDRIFNDWGLKYSNNFLGRPSLVPTALKSGDDKSPNKTASSAELILDVRTTPELDLNFEKEFDNLASEYNFSWGYHSDPVPSSFVSESSKIVEDILNISNLSKNAVVVSPGATDQGEFVNGLKNAQFVVFGPGEWSEAHHQNEFVYKEKLSKYKNWIIEFLKKN